MTEITLSFDVTINADNIDFDDDLGNDLAIFLQESFFNGEDVLEVSYKGNKVHSHDLHQRNSNRTL